MKRSTDLGELGFGLDTPGDAWLDEVRTACEPRALGRIGDYELLDEVSRGGQGIVFRARQPGTNRAIALKRMLAGSFSTTLMRLRFEREVEAAAALSHPNIITVYGMETVDGQPLLSMEWVDGVPISHWACPPGGVRRDPEELLRTFLRVTDAVSHAHSRGILHRDLKPTNVLVDSSGEPRVLDFGLAKWLGDDADMSRSSDLLGTPAYAAPEQLRGPRTDGGADDGRLDARCDVYALGVVLYEMLTGELPHPFEGDLVEFMQRVETRTPPPPSRTDPRLGSELDTILAKALSADRSQRYATVDAFAGDLRRYLAGRPIEAVAPSTAYLLRKLVARNRVTTAFLATVFVLSLAFAGYAARQAALLREALAESQWRERQMEDWLVFVPDSVLKAASLNPDYAPPELTSRDAVREALMRASRGPAAARDPAPAAE